MDATCRAIYIYHEGTVPHESDRGYSISVVSLSIPESVVSFGASPVDPVPTSTRISSSLFKPFSFLLPHPNILLLLQVGDNVVELNGVPVSPTISDREFVEQLMSLSRPVVLGFTRQGKDFVSAAREEEEANRAAGAGAPATPEGYMVGGISMDEVLGVEHSWFLLPFLCLIACVFLAVFLKTSYIFPSPFATLFSPYALASLLFLFFL